MCAITRGATKHRPHMPGRKFNPQTRTKAVIYHAWTDVDGVADLPPLAMIEQGGSATIIGLDNTFGEAVDKDSLRYFRTTVVTTVESVEVDRDGRVIRKGLRPITGRRPYPNAPNRLM